MSRILYLAISKCDISCMEPEQKIGIRIREKEFIKIYTIYLYGTAYCSLAENKWVSFEDLKNEKELDKLKVLKNIDDIKPKSLLKRFY